MEKLNRSGYAAVREAAAVVATKLARQTVEASQKGKANKTAERDLGRVAMIMGASQYLSNKDTKDLLTYLSLL